MARFSRTISRAIELTERNLPVGASAAGLFRAQAIEGLSTPDRADLAAAVVAPSGWLLLLSACFAVAVLVAGLTMITVPLRVAVPAIILAAGGVRDVAPSRAGLVQILTVQPGAHVAAGDVLARLQDGAAVTAPAAGTVIGINQDEGDAAAPDRALVELAADPSTGSPTEVAIFLMRPLAARLVPGGPVRILPSDGSGSLPGHLIWIAARPAAAESLALRRQLAPIGATPIGAAGLVEARVVLDNPAPRLAGLPATVTLELGRQNLLRLLLPTLALAAGPGGAAP